jgi:mono/diheme cytochrome c family protein
MPREGERVASGLQGVRVPMSKPLCATAIVVSAVWGTSLLLAAQQRAVLAPLPATIKPAGIRNPLATTAAAIPAGGRLFNDVCSECHGINAAGSDRAPALDTGGFMHGGDDGEVFRTIRKGVDGTEMDGHPDFSDEETWQLVAYIKNLSGGSRDRTFTERYCLGCHNGRAKTGGLSLQGLALEDITAHGPVWEKVLGKVRSGDMPPVTSTVRPDAAAASAFATFLETTLDREAAAHPNPGRALAHRLNRAEYSNAVRDLLAVDVKPGAWLPVDDSGYGFDNIAAVLSTSPALLERYMSAARTVSRLAVGDLSLKPGEDIYDAKTDPGQASRNEQLNEQLPFGSRGGMSVEHYFPVDAEYTITLRSSTDQNPVNGADPYVLRRFVPAGLHVIGATSPRENLKPEAEAAGRGGGAAGGRRGPAALDLYLDGERVRRFETANGPSDVRRMIVSGPYNTTALGNTPSRARVFICRPAVAADEAVCARRILSSLARQAFRRPVTSADIDPLHAVYQTGRTGGDFERGIEAALRAILVSPEYLFRIEYDPARARPGQVYRVSDVDLASRLSFFLWSSIPDETLLGLAEQGRLKDPVVLRRQVERMLNDQRAQALVENFVGQWLQIRSVEQVRPDVGIFAFDEALRRSFVQETMLLVGSIVKEDRSLLDLLDADYTFLNQRLAEHYGVPNVYGSQFRRVAVTDQNRRGLLGQGSILTITSYPNRTSVVQRGRWVLESLLGTPPPPPPANVPDLKAAANGKLLSMRDQMQMHRANPVCSSCHSRMDPIGFALENYDGVGRWRDDDAGAKVDASGKLPDGTEFRGPAGLRQLLLTKYKEDFVRTATEKLLTYALGRGLESYDYPTVRAIAREASKDNYRISSLIAGVVHSTPFQMRRVSEP